MRPATLGETSLQNCRLLVAGALTVQTTIWTELDGEDVPVSGGYGEQVVRLVSGHLLNP